jgi:hypothetical protein
MESNEPRVTELLDDGFSESEEKEAIEHAKDHEMKLVKEEARLREEYELKYCFRSVHFYSSAPQDKREVESLNRKHLLGLQVVQKNLVYVVGLSPGIPEQQILHLLRGEKYFGQYGKIIKMEVIDNKQNDSGPDGQSLDVYVTFTREEDAARCIAAVNGSQNGDRILRAQLGTTKYCSAYVRNEKCTNTKCMFLHELDDGVNI